MKIGLALSGGGLRAAVFHLGVLGRLATENRLEDVKFISTVSGGSLCIGLVLSANQYKWPASGLYCQEIVPYVRHLLTQYDLQKKLYLWKAVSLLSTFQHNANALSTLLERGWHITASLSDLPSEPRWIINATCHETGKRWRFEKKRMTDYSLNAEVRFPDFPLSKAMAASAALPPFLGPIVVHPKLYTWISFDEESSKASPITISLNKVHLWDGALYDNLGIEALYKRFRNGQQSNNSRDFDFLIISNASRPFPVERYRLGRRMLERLYEITGNQVQSLYTRTVMDYFVQNPLTGCYCKLGNSSSYIFREARLDIQEPPQKYLLESEIQPARDMATDARQLSVEKFECLFRHGFEVADCTLHAYGSNEFALVGYAPYHWN